VSNCSTTSVIDVNRNCRSSPRARGFTLLEVLLAVTILGIILTTVYGSLSRTLSSKGMAEERAELFANGREAVLQIAGDIEAAMPPPSGDRVYFRGLGGRGRVPSLEFVAMNRGNYGLNRARPGRVLVVYTLDPVPAYPDLFALRREEHLFSALLAEADGIAAPAAEEAGGRPTAVASYLLDCPPAAGEIQLPGSCVRVTGLSFRFFDEVTGRWDEEWDSTVEPTVGRIPSAIEVSLLLADEKGREHDFTTIVDLPLARGQPTPRPGTEDAFDNGASGDGQ
jgi:prepilin-type N-terminal cleavage/methylation domain-containing protein